MWRSNRRQFFRDAALVAAGGSLARWAAAAETSPAEIYRLLGFATMTGEDPLKLWARLRKTANGWPVRSRPTPGPGRSLSPITATSSRSGSCRCRRLVGRRCPG